MTYHILNGDVLAGQLKETRIQGQFIICAECLVDGDLTGDTLLQFWASRAKYIADTYNNTDNYYHKCVSEFEKIINLPGGSEVYLWFENDLFCQTNMWFVLSLLFKGQKQNNIDRFPTDNSPGRPDLAVKEIIQNKSTEFQEVFSEFSEKHGIYGFGDLQVRTIYDRQFTTNKQ